MIILKIRIRQIALFLFSFFILSLLTGCNLVSQMKMNVSHDVVFIDNPKIAYKDKSFKTSSLIKSIDGDSIQESSIEGRYIYYQNIKIVCPEVNTERMGVVTLIYKIGKESYKCKATITDTSAPVLKLKTSNSEINCGDHWSTSKIDYDVSDNLDSSDKIHIIFKGSYDVNKCGVYKIDIIATDSYGNSSKALCFNLKVVDKDRKAKKEEDIKRKSEKKDSKSNITKKSENKKKSVIHSKRSSGLVKYYMYSDGYNMVTAPRACQSALSRSGRSGNCSVIYGNDGVEKGMKLTLY